jgi:hypothetical protein
MIDALRSSQYLLSSAPSNTRGAETASPGPAETSPAGTEAEKGPANPVKGPAEPSPVGTRAGKGPASPVKGPAEISPVGTEAEKGPASPLKGPAKARPVGTSAVQAPANAMKGPAKPRPALFRSPPPLFRPPPPFLTLLCQLGPSPTSRRAFRTKGRGSSRTRDGLSPARGAGIKLGVSTPSEPKRIPKAPRGRRELRAAASSPGSGTKADAQQQSRAAPFRRLSRV